MIDIKRDPLIVKLDTACDRCGSYTFEFRYKKPHVGQYCKCCGRYVKWLSSSEKQMHGIIVSKENMNTEKIIETQSIRNETRRNYEIGLDDEVPF